MKNVIIAILLVIIVAGAVGVRVTRIQLEPRVVAAYNARVRKPRNISRITHTDNLIRKDVRDIVFAYERRLNVPDVNEIAR